ncbi:MAG: glycosyltransferase family 39 protein [Anaerolineae bacterium]|nr:glycosyltransferase family 39 protein [Anaerolineae bacterium]MCI0607576.1 glycosyltransferase family 39 protein [Anaerolineae bacterium]
MDEYRNPLLIVILLLSMVIGSSHLTRGHEWGDDFASYIMQANSILNGDMQNFVEHNSITIYQSSSQIGPVAYPWGYPLILTPAYAVKGISPLALKLPGLFFFAGFLICFYVMMRTRLTRTESLLLVSLFAFNPMLVDFLDQILSDIPFLFFSTLALLLMINEKKRSALDYALLGGVLAFAFFIRTTGILLLATFLIVELFKIWDHRTNRQWIMNILRNIFIVCITFGILWVVYSLIFPGGSESYLDQLKGFNIQTVLGFINEYFQLFSAFFGQSIIWKNLYYLLFLFFLIGIWLRRKDDFVFIIFFSLWMLMLVIWPIWQGPRFIFPLFPVFIYFTFQGMKSAINKLPETYHQFGERVFYGFWLLIAGIFLFNSSVNAYVNLRNSRSINGPFDPYSIQVYDYIKEKTPSDSIVVFFKPRAMRLMTDHDTIMSTECEHMSLGDYIVLSRKVGENQQITPEEIDSCNLLLDEVLRNRRFIIYEILK